MKGRLGHLTLVKSGADLGSFSGPSQESAKQENPFSFKHFLRDSAASTTAATTTMHGSTSMGNNNHGSNMSSPNSNNICHSRSTSIINGTESQTPSKSATTSSLSQNHNTGARPKIPQFQSVHALAGGGAESKMKRSPRFPSFDSQSSLSELSDERSNLFHSCSNSSFNSEHPVQRSFSNYDIESPTGSPKYDRKTNHTGSQSANLRGFVATNRVGTAEFSAALPDFVQDHIVMEQWYQGLGSPKSNSPVSVDFDNLPDFTINSLDDVGRVRTIDAADAFELNHARNRTPARNASPIVPLDLPTNRSNDLDYGRREQAPPDLPPDVTEGQRGAFGYVGADINRDQADKMQTLPDFLSDGPIHSSSRLADVTQDTPHFNSPDENPHNVTIARLQAENDRLRNELDDSRQIIINQTCRISELEHLLLESRQNSIANAEQQLNSAARGDEGAYDGGKRDFSGGGGLTNKLKQQVKQLQVRPSSLSLRVTRCSSFLIQFFSG